MRCGPKGTETERMKGQEGGNKYANKADLTEREGERTKIEVQEIERASEREREM